MSTSMKLPLPLKPLTIIAGTVGLIQSATWVGLYAAALYNYLEGCTQELNEPFGLTSLFGRLLLEYFFIKEDCSFGLINDENRVISTVTSFQIFTWSSVGLSINSLWLISSIIMLFYISDKRIKSVNLVVYTWCIIALAVTMIDFTLGILFGLCFGDISYYLRNVPLSVESEYSFYFDYIRLASLLLMSIALKGFVLIILNITFTVLLYWYTLDVNDIIMASQQHSIHALEPINAFASQRQPNSSSANTWQRSYLENDQPSGRNIQRLPSNYISNSWQRNTPENDLPMGRNLHTDFVASQGELSSVATGPFSYLAGPSRSSRQSSSVNLPSTSNAAAASSPWKRPVSNWDTAPVAPTPDYSPIQNRKLKSALKPGYNI